MRTRRAESSADAEVWRDALIVDAGDAFTELQSLPEDRVANVLAGANVIVDYYNAEGLTAQAIGERDVALGRAALEALRQRAKYPFLTTNLVDAESGKPLFDAMAVREIVRGDKRVKVALFGLMSSRLADLGPAQKVKVVEPAAACGPAVAAAKAQGAEVFVVLNQMMHRDYELVAKACPEIQLFLGSERMNGGEAEVYGTVLELPGGMKGKNLGLLEVSLEDARGPSAPLWDPSRRETLERKKGDAERRIDKYTKLIAAADASPASDDPSGKAPKLSADAYQRQLTAAKAELQLAVDGLTELGAGTDGTLANTIVYELVPLSRDIDDDPKVKAIVDEHRKTWPDLTPH